MNKRIIAAVCAAALVPLNATAEKYYTERRYAPYAAYQREYTEYDISGLEEISETVSELLDDTGKDAELSVLLDECYDSYCAAADAYAAAYITAAHSYSAAAQADADKAFEICSDASKIFTDTIEAVYKSGYDYVLDDVFTPDAAQSFTEQIPSDRFYELAQRESELISDYNEISKNGGSCTQLFLELVKVRNDIAAECGYDNYAQYSKEVYMRGFTDEQTALFCEETAQYIKPVYLKLTRILPSVESFALETDEKTVLDNVGNVLRLINPELGESYDYMCENKLYDISYSASKLNPGSAFTYPLTAHGSAFLFSAPAKEYGADATDAVQSLIHEAGHFSALLNDPVYDKRWGSYLNPVCVDTGEIQSQGLELLAERYYGRLFGRGAAGARYKRLHSLCAAIIDGCMFNEWQTRVFECDELTVDKCNEFAAELLKKYYDLDYTPAAAERVWTSVPHNFHSPMYYFSYALSGAAALKLYTEPDYDKAVDTYMRLSALGSCVPFTDAAEQCGLGDIFEKGTMERLAAGIERECALGYSDVDYSSWYADYLYEVSAVFDGTGEKIFEPDTDITRADFVELIGRIYDYYTGIDKDYTLTFKDIDSSDSCAEYIAWAAANGIVEGYSDTEFGGDDNITREQLVTVLYRFAGITQGGSDKYLGYADSASVSEWAAEPVAWAVDSGIINGRENNMLVPRGGATRAEAAKIAACYIRASL